MGLGRTRPVGPWVLALGVGLIGVGAIAVEGLRQARRRARP